jgi:hypothetical protein
VTSVSFSADTLMCDVFRVAENRFAAACKTRRKIIGFLSCILNIPDLSRSVKFHLVAAFAAATSHWAVPSDTEIFVV